MPDETNAEAVESADTAQAKPPLKDRIVKEVRTHPFGYTVLAIFLVAGPLLAPLIFPQAPPAVAMVGGLAFGLYAALSAA